MIRFACPICHQVLSVPDHKKGDKLPCTRCGQRLQVPAHSRDKTLLGRPVPAVAAVPQRAAVGATPAGKPAAPVLEPPPPPPEAIWYYSHGGLRFGPVSWSTLQQRVSTRHLGADDLVWTAGMAYWSTATSVPGLFAQTPVGPQAPAAALLASQVPPPLPEPAKPAPLPRTGPSGPLWRRFLNEAGAIALATLTLPFVLLLWPFVHGSRLWRRRSLRRSALELQAGLGQRLYEAKAGDEHLRRQLDTLNERMLSIEATMGDTRGLKAERRGLLLRLAAPALAQDTSPTGGEPEHRQARAAQAALLTYQEQIAAGQSTRGVRWRRIGIGYGLLGVAALLFFLFPGPWTEDPQKKRALEADADDRASTGKKKPRDKRSERTGKKADRQARPATKPAAKAKPERKANKPPPEQKAHPDKFAKLKSSVALIRGERGRACGFLVRPGMIATTWTVYKDTAPGKLEVYFPSAGAAGIKPLPYKVLLTDPRRNLVLLSVKTEISPLPLANRHHFKLNEKVKAICNDDRGIADPEENDVRKGHWRVRGPLRNHGTFDGFRFSSNPPTLGGPVLNASGKVVGMITLRETDVRENVYGIPLQDLQAAIRRAEPRK